MELKNKRIFLTGASSGIGYALVKKLAAEGNIVAALARREARLDRLADETTGLPGKVYTYVCDVTDKEVVKEIAEQFVYVARGIDVAVLNSGIGRPEGIKNYSSDYAEDIFKTNVIGMVNCIEALLPVFMKQKHGIIAGVSSLADNRGYNNSGFYCASKAAVTKMLESLRIELKSFGIKVITIKPGFVKSEMTAGNNFKMPFIIETGEAAEIIFRGLRKEKRIIQFPLATVIGSKIIGILPGWLFEYLNSKR
jgi:short-subunit dehydrogenase